MRALNYKNDNFKIKEPFKGLFTQGMVCHETYKDEDNNWISPEEICEIDGQKYLVNDQKKKIKVGPSESMSKSKKNLIDPEKIINNYGADSARLFILSDSPPEKDIQWSDNGIISSYKFIQKLWALHIKVLEELKKNHKKDLSEELPKFINLLIKNITNNLDSFSYNVVIANYYKAYSFFNSEFDKSYTKETLKSCYVKFLILLTPVIPHFANECLENLEIEEKIWPRVEKNYLENKKINFVIQINGKKRGLFFLNANTKEKELLEMIKNNKDLSKYTSNKEIKKIIFVPNKLINLII